MKLTIKETAFSPLFKKTFPCTSRYLIEKGGAGSGKSERAAAKFILRSLLEPGHRLICWRKVGRSLRNSTFKLLKDQIQRWNLTDFFEIKETDMVITCKINGNEILNIGLDDSEKIKSLTSPTSFWVEEATELEEKDFNQLDTRLRGQTKHYKQIMLTFNPISEFHWIKNRFFNEYADEVLMKKGIFDYYKDVQLEGKTVRIHTTLIHSTYKDNPFLDDESKATYESYKDIDRNHYEVYALGKWGSVGNLVYPNGFKFLESYPEQFDDIIYGLDFGFNQPTAFVKVGIRDGEYYLEELIYQKGLSNDDLTDLIAQFQTENYGTIYADSGEPARIKALNDNFFNRGIKFEVVPADKSVKDGILYVKASKVYTKPENTYLNKELKFYKWKEDASGNPIEGEPLKINDHLMDAVRYALYSHSLSPELKMAFI
jgi:phage terminase large subunit